MPVTISRWGNSRGVRIPQTVLERLNWTDSELVEITAENDSIIIRRAQPRQTIADLFAGYGGAYRCEPVDWGKPEGKEAW